LPISKRVFSSTKTSPGEAEATACSTSSPATAPTKVTGNPPISSIFWATGASDRDGSAPLGRPRWLHTAVTAFASLRRRMAPSAIRIRKSSATAPSSRGTFKSDRTRTLRSASETSSSVRYSAISSHSGSGSTLAPLTRSTQRPGSTWLRVRPEPGRLDLCDGPREALSPELADDPMSYLPTTSAAWLRHRDRPALGDYRPEGGAQRREGRGVTSPRASIVSGGDRRGRRHGGDLIASGLLASDQARRDSSTWASANGSWAGHSAVGSATSA